MAERSALIKDRLSSVRLTTLLGGGGGGTIGDSCSRDDLAAAERGVVVIGKGSAPPFRSIYIR